MSTKNVRGCLAMLSLLSLALFVSEVQASGPAVAQQAAVQAQSAITDASLGWHHGGWGGGWGGWGGGWHHGGWGWGGGWGYRGLGWGGGWGYGGWGYPAYGYAGYGFVRPVIYTYPTYTYVRVRAPRYCCGYSYTLPTSCCDNNTINTTTTYTVAGTTYPAQPVAYTSSYSDAVIAANRAPASPVYTSGTTYSKFVNSNRTTYGSDVYTPTLSNRMASAPASQSATRNLASSVSSTYPPAPVAYTKPIASQQPIAKRSTSVLHAEYLAASAAASEVASTKVAARIK